MEEPSTHMTAEQQFQKAIEDAVHEWWPKMVGDALSNQDTVDFYDEHDALEDFRVSAPTAWVMTIEGRPLDPEASSAFTRHYHRPSQSPATSRGLAEYCRENW